jgi:hypothetical protein
MIQTALLQIELTPFRAKGFPRPYGRQDREFEQLSRHTVLIVQALHEVGQLCIWQGVVIAPLQALADD